MDHKKIAETKENFPGNTTTALTADEAKDISVVTRKKRFGAVLLTLVLLAGAGLGIPALRRVKEGKNPEPSVSSGNGETVFFQESVSPVGCVVSLNDTELYPLVVRDAPSLKGTEVSVPAPKESFDVYGQQRDPDDYSVWYCIGENAWISDCENDIVYLESAYASWFSTPDAQVRFRDDPGENNAVLFLKADGTFEWELKHDDGYYYVYDGTFVIEKGRIEACLDHYPVHDVFQEYVPVSFEIRGENEIALVSEIDGCGIGTVLNRSESYYSGTVDPYFPWGTLFINEENISVVSKPLAGSLGTRVSSSYGHRFPVYDYSGFFYRLGDKEWVSTQNTDYFMFYVYDENTYGWFGENTECLFSADDGAAELWLHTDGTADLLGSGYASDKDDKLEAYFYDLSAEGDGPFVLCLYCDGWEALFALDGTDHLTLETDLPSCPAGTGFSLNR